MKNGLAGQEEPGDKKKGFEVSSEPLIFTEGDTAINSKFSDVGDPPISETSSKLPDSYGANLIFLIAQAPYRLFTYWDIDISRHPGGATYLRCLVENNTTIECEIEVPFEARNWYVPVSKAGVNYFVEIGYYRGSRWNRITRSQTVRTPVDEPSASDSFDHTTAPLHVRFPQLLERIRNTIHSEENLDQALACLQKAGQFPGADISRLLRDDGAILELLLGKEFLASQTLASLNTSQLQEKVQRQMEQRFVSPNSNAPLERFQREVAEGQLIAALAVFSNNALPTWDTATLSSWAAATLTTWLATARPIQGDFSHLADWKAPANLVTPYLSSWGVSEASSWEKAVTDEDDEHDFFMNVSAEVIFYGTTDPGSSVLIDGKPVKVNADGSFRCHFIFPDEAYEVPIISHSPDGLETRAAVLRFHRTSSASSGSPQNETPDNSNS